MRLLKRDFVLLCAGLALPIAWYAVGLARTEMGPAPKEQIVFLYYSDLNVADRFFGEVLGFKKTMDKDWVKIFETTSGSFVGAVKEGRGFLKTAASKPVMVTWIVDDPAAWHDRLAAKGTKIVRPLRANQESGTEGFIFEDPTGYTFEILRWISR